MLKRWGINEEKIADMDWWGKSLKSAAGVPAGGHTFEKLDNQVSRREDVDPV